jgi:hypothetical protein
MALASAALFMRLGKQLGEGVRVHDAFQPSWRICAALPNFLNPGVMRRNRSTQVQR